MKFENFIEPEIAVTAAVAAAITSPRARKIMRKGLVYGMAGMLAAGDVLVSFGRSVGQGMQRAGEEETTLSSENGDQDGENEERALPAARRRGAPKMAGTRGKAV
jgi:hypothetical protein